LASDESVEQAVKNFVAKDYVVHVVESKVDALEKIIGIIPEGSVIYSAGSTTLEEIGFTEYAKTIQANEKWDNIKSRMFAEPDLVKREEIRRQSFNADYWISSVPALSEEGDIVVVDLTGTRVGGFLTSGHLLIVASTSKLEPTLDAAIERAETFALPLESARVRVAYKSYGVTASQIVNKLVIRGGNPMGAPRTTIILVKEQLGF